MTIKILSSSGSFDAAEGPETGVIEMTSVSVHVLKKIVGPEHAVEPFRRKYRTRIPRELFCALLMRLINGSGCRRSA